jgi:hypothetical protein
LECSRKRCNQGTFNTQEEIWNVNTPAQLSDLIDAMLFETPEHLVRFDRLSGRVVMVEIGISRAVEEGDEAALAEAPAWQKEMIEIARELWEDGGSRFLRPPNNFDFHEYRLMEKFVAGLGDNRAAEQLWRAMKGKGAFRQFKNTLYKLGIQDAWIQYRGEAAKKYVINWAEENQVEFEDDTAGRRF